MLPRSTITHAVDDGLAGYALLLEHGYLSPVNLDLAGLPPTLVHVGTTEVLEFDTLAIAGKLAAAGVPVKLKHWEGRIHDFQLIGVDLLPEARQAIREIGEFVRERTA
jgi:acetyl esterase/lipase